MKFVCIVCVALMFSLKSFSSCGEEKKVLFFANGMFNQKKHARDSLDNLKTTIAQKNSELLFDDYEVAYNTNENALLQLLQVYEQKSLETKISFFDWLGKFTGFENDSAFKKIIKFYLSEEIAKDQDLKLQVQQYIKYLGNDYKIVTVAHSQGNFYTNFSFAHIKSENTKMISVATPANHVYEMGPYFTFKSDGIIAYIPTSLTPNRDKKQAGYFDHEFVEDYLKDADVSKEIINAILMASSFGDSLSSLNPKNGYFNSDMSSVLKWFNEVRDKNTKISPSECMLSYALFGVYRLHARSCEERDLKTFKESIQDCILDRNDKETHRKETSCPFYAGMELSDPFLSYYPEERFDLFKTNPFCEIDSMNDFREKIKINDLEESLKRF
jgi:hypothetical protein